MLERAPLLHGAIGRSEAFLLESVGVGAARIARLDAGLHEHFEQGGGHVRSMDCERPGIAAVRVGAAVEGLRFSEVGQHFGVGPSRSAQLDPVLVVHRVAAYVHHRVGGRRAAQDLAARLPHAPMVEPGLGLALVSPLDRLSVHDIRERGRNGDVEVVVPSAGFNEQDPGSRVLTQPMREHAARGARPDDDVVELLGHATTAYTSLSRARQIPAAASTSGAQWIGALCDRHPMPGC